MALYAEALRSLGAFLGGPERARHRRGCRRIGGAARGAAGRRDAFFDDVGFWKRAQIAANDLALAGVAEFDDLDELTIFADNLVPHVLRVDGVLVYDGPLADHIERGELLPPGSVKEREIRACAVHACVLIAERLGVPARTLDTWLWDRGQEPRYKALPRHRTRTVVY